MTSSAQPQLLHPENSTLLTLPGAVPGSGMDATVAWHYGDPLAEQRAVDRGRTGLVDRTHREVVAITGPDRLSWLNTLTSQLLDRLPNASTTEALILSPQGHVEHHFGVTDLDATTYLDTEPGRGLALLQYLESMKFWSQVELATSPLRQLSLLGPAVDVFDEPPAPGTARARDNGFSRSTGRGLDIFTTEPSTTAVQLISAGATAVGSWSDDALRIPTRRPRIGIDTDERTIPNEVSWLHDAVHLNKGCYRGQETVARVDNIGRPPRRLVILNLDGSQDMLPVPGEPVTTADGRAVGRLGTVAHHHEDGPIALALVKRTIGPEIPLLAGGVDASVDPADAVVDDVAPRSAIDHAAFRELGVVRRS